MVGHTATACLLVLYCDSLDHDEMRAQEEVPCITSITSDGNPAGPFPAAGSAGFLSLASLRTSSRPSSLQRGRCSDVAPPSRWLRWRCACQLRIDAINIRQEQSDRANIYIYIYILVARRASNLHSCGQARGAGAIRGGPPRLIKQQHLPIRQKLLAEPSHQHQPPRQPTNMQYGSDGGACVPMPLWELAKDAGAAG